MNADVIQPLTKTQQRDSRRLSWAYFGYFGVLALIVPYLAVFLDALGFNSRQIGELIAFATLCRIVGPPLWGAFCDYRGERLPAIRIGVLATLGLLVVLNQVSSYLSVALVLAFISLFWSAILPQLEVVTLNTLGQHQHRYSRIRAGGSFGFIVVALIAAELMAWGGKTSYPWLAALLLMPLAIVVWLLREPKTEAKPLHSESESTQSLMRSVKSRPFLFFMTSSILLQLSFAPFYAFFALYLGQLGYAPMAVGAMIALGVAAEVVMFLVAGKILIRYRLSRVLAFCMSVTALRWWLMGGFADYFWILILAQLAHAFSFALHHSAAIKFLHRHFPKSQQSRGQALYLGIGYAGGGAIGAFVTGILWQDGYGAELTFSLAGMAALVGAFAALGVAQKR